MNKFEKYDNQLSVNNFHENVNVILSHFGDRLFSRAQYLNQTALSLYEISEQDQKFHNYGGISNMYRPSFYKTNIGYVVQSMAAVCFAGAKIINEHVERSIQG